MESIIIIGASSGIGREVAIDFIKRGYKVGIAARRADLLAPMVNLAPSNVFPLIIDVTSENCSERLLKLIDKMGGVDTILLASGIGKQNPDLEFEIEKDTILTNVLGFTQIIDTAFNYFVKTAKHGHIAVISSIAGTKGLGVAASYSATKRYQNTYIEALEQLAGIRKLPIKFTDIRPGFVATDLLNDSHNYPMLMNKRNVAKRIINAIIKKKHVVIIDWKYSILTLGWSLIPRFIWRKLNIRN